MEATTSQSQRRRASRKPAGSCVIRVETKDGVGNPRWVTADLVDVTESGFGLALMAPLKPGSTVIVRGKLGEKQCSGEFKVGVRWSREDTGGAYRAGLEFLHGQPSSTPGEDQTPAPTHPEVLDCYEVMQLSPNADADTIGRVYRMLAQRYHPDNAQTGDMEMFVRLSEAHKILSDPERRVRYDVQHRETGRLRWKIFDRASASVGSEGEKRKRQGILGLLHARMLYDPEHADMNIQLMEELLGCPREHLQSALWYLKAKDYIRRSDNGRFTITIAGFDEAEAAQSTPARADRQLMEPTPEN